jgi:hypothetical protein
LTKYFPTDLLNETEKVIGQPDAGDWGGLYVAYNINGISGGLVLKSDQKWHISALNHRKKEDPQESSTKI